MRLDSSWPWWKQFLWGLVAGACLGALCILFCLVTLGLPLVEAVVIGTDPDRPLQPHESRSRRKRATSSLVGKPIGWTPCA